MTFSLLSAVDEDIIYTIFSIIYNYIPTIQLIVAVFMFCNKLPRRSKFAIRVAAYVAVLFAVSSFWNSMSAQDYPVWLIILRYFVIFGFATGGIMFIYRSSALQALLCGAGAYSLQHFMYRLQIVAVSFTDDVGFIYADIFVRAAIWIAVYVAAYFLMIKKRMQPDETVCRKNFRIIAVSLLAVCIVIIISALFDKYAEPGIIYYVCIAYSVVSCICIFVIINWLFTNENLKSDNIALEHMLQIKGEQLAASKETIDIINIKCHDMKHQIARLRRSSDDKELGAIEDIINIYDSSIQTGNAALDILLTEKGLLCTGKKIRLSCVADGKQLAMMSDTDVYSLFGNALDNAIRAVENLDEDRRVISIVIKHALGFVSVHMENCYEGKLKFEEGLPSTTQQDENYHGFGMKSMEHIVQKYGGYMTVDASGGIFRLNISLPSE